MYKLWILNYNEKSNGEFSYSEFSSREKMDEFISGVKRNFHGFLVDYQNLKFVWSYYGVQEEEHVFPPFKGKYKTEFSGMMQEPA